MLVAREYFGPANAEEVDKVALRGGHEERAGREV